MHEHASKMELEDKETVATYMHLSKRDILSARITLLYAYGTYHTRMVYKIVPYAYGIKYAYDTEQQHHSLVRSRAEEDGSPFIALFRNAVCPKYWTRRSVYDTQSFRVELNSPRVPCVAMIRASPRRQLQCDISPGSLR